MRTAFVASYGSGGPVIGILAEYDALSGLSQQAACPHRAPVREGAPGHGCGHSLLGAASFAAARMTCIVENIFVDGEWAILEWRDPLGLRGCGFFHVVNGKIVFQRGYWDKLTFLRQHGLPLPEN